MAPKATKEKTGKKEEKKEKKEEKRTGKKDERNTGKKGNPKGTMDAETEVTTPRDGNATGRAFEQWVERSASLLAEEEAG